MVEFEIPQDRVLLLFAALKQAEIKFTDHYNFQAAKNVSKLHDSLYRQVFTYGQVDEEYLESVYE